MEGCATVSEVEENRKERRKALSLRIKFKSETFGAFLERYSTDVSEGGIFIRTKKPLDVGTRLKFEFQLQTGAPLIVGEGVVAWTREKKEPGKPAGMGVSFEKISDDSRETLATILSRRPTSDGTFDTGPVPAPASLFDKQEVKTEVASLDDLAQTQSMVENVSSEADELFKPLESKDDGDGEFEDNMDTVVNDGVPAALFDGGFAEPIDELTPQKGITQKELEEGKDPVADEQAGMFTKEDSLATDPWFDGDNDDADATSKEDDKAEKETTTSSTSESNEERTSTVESDSTAKASDGEDEAEAEEESDKEFVIPSKAEGYTAPERARTRAAEKSNRKWILVLLPAILIAGFVLMKAFSSQKNAEVQIDAGNTAVAVEPTKEADASSKVVVEPVEPVVPKAATEKQVTFLATPAGVSVEVVGVGKGKQPFTPIVEVGKEYKLIYSAPGFAPFETTWSTELESPTPTLIAKPLRLRVEANVPGKVFIDGKLVGNTPAELEVAASKSQVALRVSKAGYRLVKQTVVMDGFVEHKEAQVKTVAVKLVRLKRRPKRPGGPKSGDTRREPPPKPKAEAPAPPTE